VGVIVDARVAFHNNDPHPARLRCASAGDPPRKGEGKDRTRGANVSPRPERTHAAVAFSIVNNNRKQWIAARGPFSTPSGCCSPQARTRRWVRFAKCTARLRPHPSRRAHARSSSQKGSRVRAPQDEDRHRLRHSSRCQTAQLVPAPALLRPGFASLLHSPPLRGGRSAEKRSGAALTHPLGVHVTRHARRLARRLASHDAGRSPLGAPPWRFWAPGAALSSRIARLGFRFDKHPDRLQRAPRSQVVVPGGRGPYLPGQRLQAAAAGRHTRSAFRMSPDDAPQRGGWAPLYYGRRT
jgi:hypothetical protein